MEYLCLGSGMSKDKRFVAFPPSLLLWKQLALGLYSTLQFPRHYASHYMEDPHTHPMGQTEAMGYPWPITGNRSVGESLEIPQQIRGRAGTWLWIFLLSLIPPSLISSCSTEEIIEDGLVHLLWALLLKGLLHVLLVDHCNLWPPHLLLLPPVYVSVEKAKILILPSARHTGMVPR